MRHNLKLGVALTLLGALVYSLQTALIKSYATVLPLPMLVFVQSLVSLLLFLPILLKGGLASALPIVKSQKIVLHLMRAVTSLGVSYFTFSALKFIPLVNAALLTNTSPLLIPFVAYVFFSQKINHRLWLPILIGFVGVALVLHPDSRIFDLGAFLALGAALSVSFTMLFVRKLSATESVKTTTFYFFLFATIISGIVVIPFWMSMTLQQWFVMALVGAMYFSGQYIMTYALRFANAQLVSSLLYVNIVYAAIISQIIWQTLPSFVTTIGMILTVMGGILCIRAEHHYNKRSQNLTQGSLQYVKESAQ